MSNSRRRRQNIGYLLGVILGLASVVILSVSWGEDYLTPGPSNVGHEDVKCKYCHISANGTFRQQIQANTLYILKQRPLPADFGHKDVSNESCLACHRRSNERHPVYRFFEPRYKKVRQQLKPHLCVSCHLEHTGKRVTVTDTGFCQSCHKKMLLKHDPISIPHHELIRAQRWQTCLGCHDFHGNHIMRTEKKLAKSITPQRIIEYFKGGESPYSKNKHNKANKEPER